MSIAFFVATLMIAQTSTPLKKLKSHEKPPLQVVYKSKEKYLDFALPLPTTYKLSIYAQEIASKYLAVLPAEKQLLLRDEYKSVYQDKNAAKAWGKRVVQAVYDECTTEMSRHSALSSDYAASGDYISANKEDAQSAEVEKTRDQVSKTLIKIVEKWEAE